MSHIYSVHTINIFLDIYTLTARMAPAIGTAHQRGLAMRTGPPTKRGPPQMATKRHFIIHYKTKNKITGTQYVPAETLEALGRKMWMMEAAKIVEVSAINAWKFNPKKKTFAPAKSLKITTQK